MNETKRNTIKWVALITAIVVLFAGVASLLFIVLHDTNDNIEQTPSTDVTEEDIPINFVALTMSDGYAVALANSGQNTVTKTITATVLPTDAPDKSVDWNVEWCVPIENDDVSDYLTVTPDSDGALTATITAYQGFEGASAYVTATTRVGGYSATCMVVYDGAPESLTFEYNGTEITTGGSLTLTAGTANDITLNLKNTLNAVGSKYGNFEITKIQAQGRFTLTKQYIVNGSISSSEDIVFNLEEGFYTYTHEVSGEKQTLTITPEEFLTASIDGNILTVKAIKNECSYVWPSSYPRTGYRFIYKGTYTDPRSGGIADNCKWYILVTDTVSGKESLIHIDIESTVTSVSMSDSIIYI